jgi:hypothetical protein
MASLQIEERGDGLLISRVAANILIMQSRTGDRLWSSALEVGRAGQQNPILKNRHVPTCLGFGNIPWNDLSKSK